MKNEDDLLPLKDKKDVLFVGHMAKEIRYQGSGSTNEKLLTEAENAARSAKSVVIFAGLTEIYESEGFDREYMKMPAGHVQMIERMAAVNENVIVVLMSGSAVEVPWIDRVRSVLYMGLPGEAGGEAIVNLLFGKANPSGKLAETWPLTYDDCICKGYYGSKDAQYREGIYVGYRYYESSNTAVRFPFGYGLSYTKFAYSDLLVEGSRVSCMVENVGNVTGKEIV